MIKNYILMLRFTENQKLSQNEKHVDQHNEVLMMPNFIFLPVSQLECNEKLITIIGNYQIT
jgi:hypothetical protein